MKHLHFILAKGIYPYRTGGMEIFNFYFIKSLLKEGYRISYSAYSRFQIEESENFKSKKLHKLRPSKIFEPFQTAFYLLGKKVDTVVFSFSRGPWIMWQLYRLLLKAIGVEYIAIIHLGQKPQSNKHTGIIKKFFQGAKAVVAVSDDIKKNYDELYDINCITIPPLVPFEISKESRENLRTKYDIPQESTVICMVGTVKGMKNPDTILRAIASFSTEEQNEIKPFILFAGGGDKLLEMKDLAKELNIDKNVKFLGNVAKEKVNEIYKLSDIYVIASDYEGTSVSLLEAMYNKKPIIASKARGIVDMLTEGHNCLMFNTKNEKELKDAVINIASDKNKATIFSKNAQETYHSKYSYQQIIEQYKIIL